MSIPSLPSRLLLGITGGVAAYKAAELARLAQKAGWTVRVVMTEAAQRFIGPATFQALTGEPVYTDAWDTRIPNQMPHIALTRWADVILVAPASADFMARAAQGLADDLLATCAVSRKVPLLLAPAMNVEMWQHPATQRNVAQLRADGVQIIGPAAGEQACGETGAGRLVEPADLLAALQRWAAARGRLQGEYVLITAGPTFEPIDPVRGVTNTSSGKMGYALAAACLQAGARVTLISGPVALMPPAACETVHVQTAAQMHAAVMAAVPGADLFFAVAAVADYTPAAPLGTKLKKDAAAMNLRLIPTRDILADVAALPKPPFCVGFAAETDKLESQARAKRLRKGVPVIAANLAQQAIGADDNTLWVDDVLGSRTLGPAAKTELAQHLLDHVLALRTRLQGKPGSTPEDAPADRMAEGH